MADIQQGYFKFEYVGPGVTIASEAWASYLDFLIDVRADRQGLTSYRKGSSIQSLTALATNQLYLGRANTAFTLADANLVHVGATAPPVATQLTPPTGLAATPLSSSSIGVSWNAVANATGYRLRQGGIIIYTGPNTSYLDTGLQASFTYTFDVQALYSGSGPYSSSDYSATAQATTAQAQSGGPITIASFTPASQQVGQPVLVTGTGFVSGMALFVGSVQATAVTVTSSTRLTFIVPSGATTNVLHAVSGSNTANSTSSLLVTQIAAPANVLVDDSNDRMSTDLVAGYPNLNQYTYSLNGGQSFATIVNDAVIASGRIVLTVGPVRKAVGEVQIRVDVTNSVTGAAAYNTAAFTVAAAGTRTLAQNAFVKQATLPYEGFINRDYPAYYGEDLFAGSSVLTGAANYSPTPGQYQTATVAGTRTRTKISAPFTAKGPSLGIGLDILGTPGHTPSAGFSRLYMGVGMGDRTSTASDGYGIYYDSTDPQGPHIGAFMQKNGVMTTQGIAGFNAEVATLRMYLADEALTIRANVPGVLANAGQPNDLPGIFRQIFSNLVSSYLPAFQYDPRALDFCPNITHFFVMFEGENNPANSSWKIGNVEWGYLKGVGNANFSGIKLDTGQYYSTADWSLFGGSVAHPAPGGFKDGAQTANGAIFKLDHATAGWKQRNILFAKTTMADGRTFIVGNNAYTWAYDTLVNLWRIKWGRWSLVEENNEAENQLCSELAALPPEGTAYCFEPGTPLTVPDYLIGTGDTDEARYDGLYHVHYNYSGGGVANIRHVTSPNWNGPTWTLAGQYSKSGVIMEGPKIIRADGTNYYVATDYTDGTPTTVMNLRDATLQTVIASVPIAKISEAPSPSHFAYSQFPLPDGTYQPMLVLFDGTKDPVSPTPYSWGVPYLLYGQYPLDGANIPYQALPA